MRLLTQVHDMEIAFDGFWEKHQLKMEQYLQLWKFEQDFQEVSWNIPLCVYFHYARGSYSLIIRSTVSSDVHLHPQRNGKEATVGEPWPWMKKTTIKSQGFYFCGLLVSFERALMCWVLTYMTGTKLLPTMLFVIQIYFREKMLSDYGIAFQGNDINFLLEFFKVPYTYVDHI